MQQVGGLGEHEQHRTGRAVGITAALRGAGGYGKTQLARWLCQQERIVDHFYDGILWVELGENPETTGSLQARVEELIRKLRREVTHEDTGFNSAFGAAKRLFELLDKGGTKDKGRFLLVIDDAWRKSDVDLFMGGAPGTVRLVTTRLDDTLPLGTDKIPVDAMKPAEAVELLTVGLDRLGVSSGQINEAIKAEIDANRPAPAHLAGRLGEWALLLTLANGQLRNEIEAGSPLPEALRYVEHIYDEMGLTAFDPKDEKQRSRVAALSIGASLRHLTPDEVARFEDLALFPEDEHIPVATIARLWAKTGSVDDLASQHLLRKLKKYALLMGLDLASATARLHDVMRKYLRDRVGVAGLIERHKAWLAAYDGSRGQSLVGAEQLYYYHRRPLHLAEAGEQAALDTLLTDVAWMQEKLAALGGPLPLIEDYRAYAPYDPANKAASALIGRALSLSAGALSRDVRQLVPHFLGRLLADMAPGMDEVLVQACRILRPPALIPRRPTLTPADSALLWTFEGHGGEVNSAAFSPDGRRIVSGSWDKTVRQWETATGATIGAPLAGHKEEVRAVAFSPDGTRIVSGSRDGTLRLWNAASGAAVGGPLAVPGPNKRLVAYNPATGRLIGKAPNYGGYWVTSVSFSPDGRRIVSGQFDGALRLWNAATGEAIGTPLKGHGAIINAVAISPDGQRIVSGSTDETLRLWDAASGAEIGKPLEGHGGRV
ncbi:MAG: NB-ARC domain-containing protein, partial [Hyphomicrobium sp.]